MVSAPTIFQSNFFMYIILPFVLVFTIVFAVLEKSKVFGEGKRQINAIVALVIGLAFVAFADAVEVTMKLVPFLAVSLVIIMIFLILWGSVHPEGKFDVPGSIKWAFAAIITIALVIAVLVVTGSWATVYNAFTGSSSLAINIVVVVVIVGVIVAVLYGGKKSGGSS